jgi:uncharacterized protein YbjT (DUF2867 family)
MSQPFVIFGAAGARGRAVVQAATRRGMPVRAVARSAENLAKLAASLGSVTATLQTTTLETATADFDDIASLRHVLRNAAAAFAHLPIAQGPTQPPRWLANLLQAASDCQLPWLEFSSSGPAAAHWRASPLIDVARATTQRVLSGAVPATALRPTLYLENLAVPVFVPRLADKGA